MRSHNSLNLLLLAVLFSGLSTPVAAQQPEERPHLSLAREDVLLRPRMRIAHRHYIWNERATDNLPGDAVISAEVRCTVSINHPYGITRCTPVVVNDHPAEDDLPITALLNRYLGQAIPRLSDELQEQISEQGYGTASFQLELPLADIRPPDNPPPERLVARRMVDYEEAFARLTYPPWAIRREVEGKLYFTCLIHTDQSGSCSIQEFDPPENRGVFESWFIERTLRVRMPDRLTDGTPSAGVRFNDVISFRLN